MASSDALQATARSSLCVERTLSQSPTITQDKSCRNQRQLFIKNKSVKSWHTLCIVHPLWQTIFVAPIIIWSHYPSDGMRGTRSTAKDRNSKSIHPSTNLNA